MVLTLTATATGIVVNVPFDSIKTDLNQLYFLNYKLQAGQEPIYYNEINAPGMGQAYIAEGADFMLRLDPTRLNTFILPTLAGGFPITYAAMVGGEAYITIDNQAGAAYPGGGTRAAPLTIAAAPVETPAEAPAEAAPWYYYYKAPELPHTKIEVNFEVEIEGDSALNIFGDQFVAPTNVIVAAEKLPVDALYDAENKTGLIEIWEPSADPDNIYAHLANSNSLDNGGYNLTGAYKVALKRLAHGLQHILCGKFDCKDAVPFNADKYKNKVEYTTQRDFGRVALGAFAHFLFGHVDATSAITNDVSFVKSMLSLDTTAAKNAASGTAVIEEGVDGTRLRYNAWGGASGNVRTEVNGTEIHQWSNETGSASDANLARRLVAAIVKKGLNLNGTLKTDPSKVVDATLSGKDAKATLAYIVRQVVGQDATRLMNEDNSERTKDHKQLLRFYPDDVIYMNIKLNTPSVNPASGQTVNKGVLERSYSVQNYTLKITLGEKEALTADFPDAVVRVAPVAPVAPA
jgi:hypothetical protein